MKNKLKLVIHWILWVAISFVLIYLFVFVGGWKLFESGDVILIEIGVAFIVGTVLYLVFESTRAIEKDYSSKIAELEKRIEELEKKL